MWQVLNGSVSEIALGGLFLCVFGSVALLRFHALVAGCKRGASHFVGRRACASSWQFFFAKRHELSPILAKPSLTSPGTLQVAPSHLLHDFSSHSHLGLKNRAFQCAPLINVLKWNPGVVTRYDLTIPTHDAQEHVAL